jgi:hypothetical protein
VTLLVIYLASLDYSKNKSNDEKMQRETLNTHIK